MTAIVSLGDVRSQRMRVRLAGLAEHPHGLAVETRDATISARRIFCRDTGAVLIDRYGCQTRLGYNEILDITPMFPLAELIAVIDRDLGEHDMHDGDPDGAEPAPQGAIVSFGRDRLPEAPRADNDNQPL
jgi:hypothetical protein